MVDRSLFIDAMRHVAQSVTVVTTLGEDGPTGATVSAFSSLSADPPSVLVCLRSDSRIGLAVGRNRVFCVNVLPESARALAGRFAGRFDAEEPDRFGAIDCRDSASGPVISGATAFECTVDQIITHGSHDICIGNVTAITNAATNRLFEDGDSLDKGALEVAQRLANGPRSLTLIRKAYWQTWSNSYEQQLELEAQLQNEAGKSADFREGVSAFLQKRDAQFKGQ